VAAGMAGFKGTTGRAGSWEDTYRSMPARELPWNSGSVDVDLEALVSSGAVRKGRAWDLGCGPGNDAAWLAKRGFSVRAVDLAPSALRLARATARKAGVRGPLRFTLGDVLALKGAGDASLVQDRGCFHTLPSDSWDRYAAMTAGLLGTGGLLALKTFSSREPAGRGPYRFKRAELRSIFKARFEVLEIRDTHYDGPVRPRALFCVLRKRS